MCSKLNWFKFKWDNLLIKCEPISYVQLIGNDSYDQDNDGKLKSSRCKSFYVGLEI